MLMKGEMLLRTICKHLTCLSISSAYQLSNPTTFQLYNPSAHQSNPFFYCFNKTFDFLRVGIGIDAVTQVGDVASWTELPQHLPRLLPDLVERGVQHARIEIALQGFIRSNQRPGFS